MRTVLLEDLEYVGQDRPIHLSFDVGASNLLLSLSLSACGVIVLDVYMAQEPSASEDSVT
jgi:hypothetical protein